MNKYDYITNYEANKYCAECTKRCTKRCDIIKKAIQRMEEDTVKSREVRLRAQKKYDEAHREDYKAYYIKFNKATEADIIEFLESVKNKQGLIKELIRKEMRGGE